MNTLTVHRQKGFGLIELMVALVIGLVISFATLSLYSTTTVAIGQHDNDAEMAENASRALDTLSRHIRNAGYVDWLGTPTSQDFLRTAIPADSFYFRASSAQDLLALAASSSAAMPVPLLGASSAGAMSLHGCNRAYAQIPQLLDYSCSTTPGPESQSLSVAYQVQALPDTQSISALVGSFTQLFGQTGDCGNNSPGVLAINRFYINSQNLVCRGNGTPSDVRIANNIEQLVFRYGLAQTTVPASATAATYTGDMMVSRFEEASSTTPWPLVTAVEICVLVMGDVGSRPATVPNNVGNDCRGTAISSSDTRLRRVYRTLVSLPNRLRSNL